MRGALILAAIGALASSSCRYAAQVGSLVCAASSDCAPPASVCGADGRCVPGCLADPDACVAGASCDAPSGECRGGGVIGGACQQDSACDPPDLVCSPTHQCVAGCTVGGACAAGFRCNPGSGHCCDDDDPGCPQPPGGSGGCNTDSECVGAPATICSGGACVPGCATTGCAMPLTCDDTTGHCATMRCTRDLDCDPGSYCTQGSVCAVLAFGGKTDCAGGTVVSYRCATQTTPGMFASCVGAPGPVGCPYCIDHSCLHAGLCDSDNECHRGDVCIAGLCRVTQVECPETVPIADVVAGKFAAGKELCVRDTVQQVRTGYDGMNEIRLGTTPFLYVDVPPMYRAAGVTLPSVGDTVTVHGTVRWDASHADYELLPVDFISP